MKISKEGMIQTKNYCKNNKNRICFVGIIFALYVLGRVENQYNLELISLLMIFSWMCVFFVKNIAEYYLQCIMMFSFFLFLIDRPLIGFLRGYVWWDQYLPAIHTVLTMIIILLIFFWGGTVFSKQISIGQSKKNQKRRINIFESKFVRNGAILLYILSIGCKFYVEMRRYIELQNQDYTAMYLDLNLEFPLFIRILSGVSVFLLAVVLSYNFTKLKSFLFLSLYVLSGSFEFLLGNRTSLMAKILFAVIYYCIRHFATDRKELWFGKVEKTLICVMIPVSIIGLGVMNYSRSDESIEPQSFVGIVSDFFYKQGTTFDTVCQGVQLSEELQEEGIMYTIGPIQDYLNDSTLGRIVFGTTPIPDGNSIIRAKEGHEMAHRLSYRVLGKEYLNGRGRGSSFILEIYMDFGYVGLGIWSLLLGIFCSKIGEFCKKQYLYVIILIILTQFFMITRNSALGIILFIIQPQFWIMWGLVVGLYIIEKIFLKRV